jgi:hypothetical protein
MICFGKVIPSVFGKLSLGQAGQPSCAEEEIGFTSPCAQFHITWYLPKGGIKLHIAPRNTAIIVRPTGLHSRRNTYTCVIFSFHLMHLMTLPFPVSFHDSTFIHRSSQCPAPFQFYWGSLHTRANSRDHGIVRAQKKVSKGFPNTPSKSCSVVTILECSVKSYVTGPSIKCCFNEFLFMWVLAHD